MQLITFRARPESTGGLRGTLALGSDCTARDLDNGRFDLDVELRCLACYDLPRALRPAPFELADTLRPRRFQDHLARVRRYLVLMPPAAAVAPGPLAQLETRTGRLRLLPAFEQLALETRAQLLLDWRDELARQLAAGVSECRRLPVARV